MYEAYRKIGSKNRQTSFRNYLKQLGTATDPACIRQKTFISVVLEDVDRKPPKSRMETKCRLQIKRSGRKRPQETLEPLEETCILIVTSETAKIIRKLP